MSRFMRPILLLLLVGGISSCSFVKRNTVDLLFTPPDTSASADSMEAPPSEAMEVEQRQSSKVTIEERRDSPAESTDSSSVEILWEIPKESVDGFIIHYGYSRDSLDFMVRLDVDEIEKFEDPRYGFVYRHLMEELPSDKSIYVALATVQGEEISELSEVFEVTPIP